MVTAENQQFKRGIDDSARMVEKFDKQLSSAGSGFGKLLPIAAIGLAGKAIVSLAADAELTRISFNAMLQDEKKAGALLDDLRQFAIKTPFTSKEVTEGSKQLLAYGFAANEIIPAMKALGDVSSALNLDMNDLVYVFGTARTQGKIFTRDLMQFSQRGIPILAELGKVLGVSKSQVLNLTEEGKVDFDHIVQAFNNMTQKGGLFFNMMQKQSDSLKGKWSTFIDTIELTGTALGTSVVESLGLRQILEDATFWVMKLGDGAVKVFKFFKPMFAFLKASLDFLLQPFKFIFAFFEMLADVISSFSGKGIEKAGDWMGNLTKSIEKSTLSFEQMRGIALDVIYAIHKAWLFVEDAFVFFGDVIIGGVVSGFLWMYKQIVKVLRELMSVLAEVDLFDFGAEKAKNSLDRDIASVQRAIDDYQKKVTGFQWGDNAKGLDEKYKEIGKAIGDNTKAQKDFNEALKIQKELAKEIAEFAMGANKEFVSPYDKFLKDLNMLKESVKPQFPKGELGQELNVPGALWFKEDFTKTIGQFDSAIKAYKDTGKFTPFVPAIYDRNREALMKAKKMKTDDEFMNRFGVRDRIELSPETDWKKIFTTMEKSLPKGLISSEVVYARSMNKVLDELLKSSEIDMKPAPLPNVIARGTKEEASLIANFNNQSTGKPDFNKLIADVIKAIKDKEILDIKKAEEIRKAIEANAINIVPVRQP